MTADPSRTLLRPGILLALTLAAILGAYGWWMHAEEPFALTGALPFAGLLLVWITAALATDFIGPAPRAVVLAALTTTLLIMGVAALMSLGLALLVLALGEAVLLWRQVEHLSARHATATVAIGVLLGGLVVLGFFSWTARAS